MHKKKIIFLDIDGVLNGYSFLRDTLAKKIFGNNPNMINWYRKHFDIFGVDRFKVFILWIIIKLTGAKIVLSSSWRFEYMVNYNDKSPRQKALHDAFKFFHIEVLGITGRDKNGLRGLEIKDYINKNILYIESFVIIDDEKFDIESYYPDRLVLTNNKSDDIQICYLDTGLKFKHIKQVVNILKQPIKMEEW